MKCSKDCLLLAGVGGMIPTISRMASTYVTDPSTPLPEPGLFLGLFLFFIIGSVLALAFSETNLRQAFIIGVCAPGIITNIVAGMNDARYADHAALQIDLPSVSTAYAQAKPPALGPDTVSVNNASRPPSTRRIRIYSEVIGASPWDKTKIPLNIVAIEKDGTKNLVAQFSAFQKRTDFTVPIKSSSLSINAGGFPSLVLLPDVNFSRAVIITKVRVEGKNDFLWALGAKRKPHIVSVESHVSDVDWIKPEVSVKKMLGAPVKMLDGTVAGNLEDIEMGYSRQIEIFMVIREKTGNTESIPIERFKIANNALVLEPPKF